MAEMRRHDDEEHQRALSVLALLVLGGVATVQGCIWAWHGLPGYLSSLIG
jgi:hypothetical protein